MHFVGKLPMLGTESNFSVDSVLEPILASFGLLYGLFVIESFLHLVELYFKLKSLLIRIQNRLVKFEVLLQLIEFDYWGVTGHPVF